jgi:aspartate carbamoyltransferase catalytic subunit
MNLGVEIVPDVAYGGQSVVLRQVTHGVAVRMAALYGLIAARAMPVETMPLAREMAAGEAA